jgi:hypothetical protein
MKKSGDLKNADAGNYIIGAGVTGLLAGLLLNDYKIISRKENIGGQLNAPFQLGPRFIRKNKSIVSLLKKLKVDFLVKNVKIGYFNGEEVLDSPTEEMKQTYVNKTRGQTQNSNSFMNDGLNTMKVLKFDMDAFIFKLQDEMKKQIIDSDVVKIDVDKKELILDNGRVLKYNKLISTIHYVDLCSLINKKTDLQFGDIFFFLTDKTAIPYDKKYAFVYIISDNLPFNRMTNTKDGVVLESPKSLSKIDFDRYKIKRYYILKNGKLKGTYNVEQIPGIVLLGRYATLDNEIRIHNICDKIMELKKNGQA